MITYTLIPYCLAKMAGEIQNQILDTLASGVETIEQVSWSKADELMNQLWIPFTRAHNLNVKKYLPRTSP